MHLKSIVDFNAAMAKETEGKELDMELLRPGVEAVLTRDDLGFYLVAEYAGRPVGQLFVTYEWSDWRNAFFWWIQSVYVSSDFRRMGVYKALHAYAETEARSKGNYRIYAEGALEQLLFVRSAQAAGFTLSNISALLRFRDGDAAPCQEVQAIVTARLDDVTEQIGQLSHVQGTLHQWLRVCREAERSGRCGVLEGLAGGGSKSVKKTRKRT